LITKTCWSASKGWDATAGVSDREACCMALDSELLLLDDLGARRGRWVEDTVASIITYRCNNGKPLIATTDRTIPVAESLWWAARPGLARRAHRPRARSRAVRDVQVMRIRGVEDFRLRKTQAV
jgi:hypothetical protein